MNIYFAGSVRGGRSLQPVYDTIVKHLQRAGHTVLTEAVASETVLLDERNLADEHIFRQAVAWLDECDAVVAEVSVPSLGVGYEISYALHKAHKPVLCLCQEGVNLSVMLTGNPDGNCRVVFYATPEAVLQAVDEYLVTQVR